MKYLMDTHIVLWMSLADKSLSKSIKKVIETEENEIFMSMASIWELGIKISLKKLVLPFPLKDFIQDEIIDNGFGLLPIKKEHIFSLETLPFHHRDPFDRLLISQAKVEAYTVLTADKIFKKYKIPTLF